MLTIQEATGVLWTCFLDPIFARSLINNQIGLYLTFSDCQTFSNFQTFRLNSPMIPVELCDWALGVARKCLPPVIALCSYPLVKMEIRDSIQILTTAPIFLQSNYFRQKYLEIASCSDSLLIHIWVRVDHSRCFELAQLQI